MKLRSLRYLGREGIKNIWSNRTMSFASVGVLVSCLLMTGAAVLFSMNINAGMKTIEGNNSVRVYMKQGLPTLSAVKAGEEIKKLDNVASCEFVPKDEAIKQYMNMLGDKDGTMLAGMTGKDNPLPDAYKVSFKDLSQYKKTAEQIKKISGVDTINDYSDIANKLTNLDRIVTTAGSWIILLLSLVSLFIISNTIRVTMFSRRLEISIMKSVGATDWFVRVPFVVEGVIIGVISGALASLILILGYDKLISVVTSITVFTPIPIRSVATTLTLCFIAAGALFGALGGIISIGRYLKNEGGDIVGW
ncbi:MAG: ABC transporter permease [Clostridiales bacterium]|jgi:cell division transport system permease protein|nr:ABC transporter permease [Clostridiales bacterium]